MADKQNATKDEKIAAEHASKTRGRFTTGAFSAAGLIVVALGALAAMVAMPRGRDVRPTLAGPFVTKLARNDIQVNLAGESSKRYLAMALNAEYFAYDESYVTDRVGAAGWRQDSAADPLYDAMLQDALLELAAKKSRDQVTDPVQIEAFLEEARKAVDPLLFPVCIGDSRTPGEADSRSGLRVGESIASSTMRGLLHEHSIRIDARHRTVRLDDGATVSLHGRERDLKIENELGESVYVDVSAIKSDFEGSVPVGAAGRVRRIYREKFLVQ